MHHIRLWKKPGFSVHVWVNNKFWEGEKENIMSSELSPVLTSKAICPYRVDVCYEMAL